MWCAAGRYLDQAQQISERCAMPLCRADAQLHRARLFHGKGALGKARALIEIHGYRAAVRNLKTPKLLHSIEIRRKHPSKSLF